MPSRRTNNFPESGRGLGHVIATIFGSTVGYPSDSLASCLHLLRNLSSLPLSAAEQKPDHAGLAYSSLILELILDDDERVACALDAHNRPVFVQSILKAID